ncbi:hypothetical protein PHLGIDRAFT_261570 [Phlebiopsis gigantea 11061_1 CR5-6]|uniref:Uncharacterized protein n=1 Tax=Phlebiopsis gigantea (strain 11061_1 CR5-6) TaxID=745531 RepID=A0A0C3SE98_PHLG1|nr:hypothetical protein PHLGIDRAFT_261570 [Phlebiopsis gigantea 11061_1 CR5-6]
MRSYKPANSGRTQRTVPQRSMISVITTPSVIAHSLSDGAIGGGTALQIARCRLDCPQCTKQVPRLPLLNAQGFEPSYPPTRLRLDQGLETRWTRLYPAGNSQAVRPSGIKTHGKIALGLQQTAAFTTLRSLSSNLHNACSRRRQVHLLVAAQHLQLACVRL